MTRSPLPDDETFARLGELARSALRSQAGLVKQSVELTRAALSGELDRSSAGKAYLEAVTRESASYWRAASELGLDYVSDLLALNSRVTTRILNETAATGRRRAEPTSASSGRSRPAPRAPEGAAGERATPDEVRPEEATPAETTPAETTPAETTPAETTPAETVPAEAGAVSRQSRDRRTAPAEQPTAAAPPQGARPAPRKVAVTLRGPLGGRATGTVTVVNRHPRVRRVELSASDLSDASGAPVGASLQISPRRMSVPAGEERAVLLAADLDPEHFAEGGRYTSTVEVSGGDEATLDVAVEVHE